MPTDPHHVTIEENGRVLAEAVIEPQENEGVVHAAFHTEAGHRPVGIGARLVDQVLEQPEVKPGIRLEATLPAGDAEMLARVQQNCLDVETRQAGATSLAQGTVPPA